MLLLTTPTRVIGGFSPTQLILNSCRHLYERLMAKGVRGHPTLAPQFNHVQTSGNTASPLPPVQSKLCHIFPPQTNCSKITDYFLCPSSFCGCYFSFCSLPETILQSVFGSQLTSIQHKWPSHLKWCIFMTFSNALQRFLSCLSSDLLTCNFLFPKMPKTALRLRKDVPFFVLANQKHWTDHPNILQYIQYY